MLSCSPTGHCISMHERMRDLPRHSELCVPFMHLCHGRRLAANSVVVCATKCTCREVEICASPSLLSSKGILPAFCSTLFRLRPQNIEATRSPHSSDARSLSNAPDMVQSLADAEALPLPWHCSQTTLVLVSSNYECLAKFLRHCMSVCHVLHEFLGGI